MRDGLKLRETVAPISISSRPKTEAELHLHVVNANVVNLYSILEYIYKLDL
jgi:hypothetical protein